MFSYMDELGINYVNNTQLLMDKSKKEQVFNKVYDAGHWNDLGMFYGTNALWKQIHEDLSVVIPMKKSEFEITEEEKNALPASNFRISEIVPTFKSKQRLSNETNDWRKEIELSPSYQVFYYKANESKSAEKMPKILMFQGSYYNRNTSFIESRANTYIGIHNYQNVLNLPYYYNIFKPDVVVLDAAEYVFTDSYFDSQVAELIDYNPSLLTDEITFDDKVESLKKDIKRHNAEITVSVAPGNKIDKLFLSYNAQKTKYAYLLINGEVYDFCQTDDNESLALSLKHGKVDNGDKGIILIDEKTNSKLWIPVTVQKGEPLLHQLSYSAGASKKYRKGKKVIELKTEMINNAFNSVALQLYDANTKKFMGNIATTNTEGKCASVYVHDLPSGKYKLTLKANSNLSDESVSCFVNLVKGNAYCYAFTVNKLSSKNCRITNYIIYGEQQ